MQAEKPVIELTADGSATLFLPGLNEHYHSVKGALAESLHVYIESALRRIKKPEISLLEVGFGTGLNTFLSCLEAARRHITIHYTSLELFPLSCQEAEALHYPDSISPQHTALFRALHTARWDTPVKITPYFTLYKRQVDLTQCQFDRLYDVIYFDAFAPEKQPELWEEAIFRNLFEHTAAGGVLTTYCAKGEVRRRLQRTGFQVERLAGPPGGKREILRGSKPII